MASQRPLGFHHFGLRLMREDLEEGCGAGQQWRAEGRGLSGRAGVTFSTTEVPVGVHVGGVAVSGGQMVPCLTALPWSLPLGVWRSDGTGQLAVEQGLFASSVGALLQGCEAIRCLSLGNVRQRHRSLRLGVCIGVPSHDVIRTLYLDDVAVRCSQQVLCISCDLGHQARAPRTADLPVAANGLLRSGRLQPLFGLDAQHLGLWRAADQLWGDEEVWDLVGSEHVAVRCSCSLSVTVVSLSQHTGLH